MPRPLKQLVRWDAFPFHEIDTHDRPLARNPDLSIRALEAVSSFAAVEKAMLQLYVFLMRGNSERAAASFLAVKDFADKGALIIAATQGVLPATRNQTLKKLLVIAKRSRARRERLVSWTWGYSDALPERLLLIDPTIEHLDATSSDRVLVYAKADFQRIVAENARIAKCFHAYQRISLLEGDPNEANARLFEWLER